MPSWNDCYRASIAPKHIKKTLLKYRKKGDFYRILNSGEIGKGKIDLMKKSSFPSVKLITNLLEYFEQYIPELVNMEELEAKIIELFADELSLKTLLGGNNEKSERSPN